MAIAAPHLRVCETLGVSTVFQSGEWLEGWYAAVRGTDVAPLFVLACDETGIPAMALPLIVAQEEGRRVIRFADLGVSDYNAPLLGPSAPRTPAAMATLWGAIRRALPPADLVLLEKLPQRIAEEVNPLLWLGTGLSAQTQSACHLAEPWALARLRLLPQDFRESLDSRRAKLARKAKVAFRLVETPEEVETVFAALLAQKAERCAAMGWRNLLDNERWQTLYKQLAMQGLRGGLARLMALFIDGAPAAAILGLERDGRFCDVLASFDAGRWKRHSLGLLALDEAMGLMAARGVTVYDLTIGAESYKDNFGPASEALYEYVEAITWRGMTPAMTMRAKWALRRNPRLAQFARQVATSARLSPAATNHLIQQSPIGVAAATL
ncbi:MAG: GNAT family N-acetyltransferase [Alphaproteobacteria bacterium]|nr:GNAT family N-acetyltransferase [Alphaproteobacteria bacterium]